MHAEKITEGKDIIAFNKHHKVYGGTKRKRRSKLRLKHLKLFTFICGKDIIPKACIYKSTLNLTRIGNLNRRRRNFVQSVNMKREELAEGAGIITARKRADFAVQKVLPINEEASLNGSSEKNEQCVTVTTETDKDQSRGKNKKKHISRMKELLRWWAVAPAKTEKRGKFNDQKVLEFEREGNTNEVAENDELSIESPKISFSWDIESRSTSTSSVFSVTSSEESSHFTSRRGYWITTDSEFVVLEL